MTVIYNFYLVILSALVAVLASYTALELASQVALSQGTERKIWLIGGAIAMGTGIWSMHFLAMLAFSLPISISYDVLLTLVSLLVAIGAAAQALFIVSRTSVNLFTLIAGATCMGIGIGAMHYIGMAAMEMPATIRYNPILFLLSIVIAVVTSLVALMLCFKFSRQTQTTGKTPLIVSAIIMGGAILLLHYTGMAAATFTEDLNRNSKLSSFDNTSLAVIIGLFTIILLGVTLLIATANRTDTKLRSKS